MIPSPKPTTQKGGLVISLDLELFWGVRDHKTIAQYGANILGAHMAIPEILAAFKTNNIACTWATVGLLFAKSKKDMLDYIPQVKPAYHNDKLNPYIGLESVGKDEKSDPYHFGRSLIEQIQATPLQEISTHTFGHFYCLEGGATVAAFDADLKSAKSIMERDGIIPKSIVFPRNQFDQNYISCCVENGIQIIRNFEQSYIYQAAEKKDHTKTRRALRLLDSYLPLTGCNAFSPVNDMGAIYVPSSRFLRPWSHNVSFANTIRLHRITSAMNHAAKQRQMFHLWFDPHNFGVNLAQNMTSFLLILHEYTVLRDTYGWPSLSMADAGHTTTETSNKHPKEH